MTANKQISAIARLQTLPTVFRGADLTVQFAWTSKTASHYLYLWKNRGLVDALGGHSDVFVNLLKSEHADWEKALLLVHPSALMIGLESLRQHSWITQIPTHPTVAVDEHEPRYALTRFDIQRKSAAWMQTARRNGSSQNTSSMPTLRPAWALADLIKTQGWGRCGLQPDDIDWDAVGPQDEQDWKLAATALGLPSEPLTSFA